MRDNVLFVGEGEEELISHALRGRGSNLRGRPPYMIVVVVLVFHYYYSYHDTPPRHDTTGPDSPVTYWHRDIVPSRQHTHTTVHDYTRHDTTHSVM